MRHRVVRLFMIGLAALPAASGCSKKKKVTHTGQTERIRQEETEPQMVSPGRERLK